VTEWDPQATGNVKKLKAKEFAPGNMNGELVLFVEANQWIYHPIVRPDGPNFIVPTNSKILKFSRGDLRHDNEIALGNYYGTVYLQIDAQGDFIVQSAQGLAKVSRDGQDMRLLVKCYAGTRCNGFAIDDAGKYLIPDHVCSVVWKCADGDEVPYNCGGQTNCVIVAGKINDAGDGLDQLSRPQAIVIDAEGNYFISQYSGAGPLMKWTPGADKGSVIGNHNLGRPYGFAVDRNGVVLVAQGTKVQKLSPPYTTYESLDIDVTGPMDIQLLD